MALIGISGYAGSGKDTVGLIIQWLTALDKYPEYTPSDFRDYIAQHKGKDRPLLHYEQGPGAFYTPFEIKKWAGKLKVIASILTGIVMDQFEDQEFKKTYLDLQWGKWVANSKATGTHVLPVYDNDPQFVPMSVREFLQRLGTDALRNGLHEDTWVNALMADYKSVWNDPDPIPGNDYTITYRENYGETSLIHYDGGSEAEVFNHEIVEPNWIITDTRFFNEAQAIRARDGILIRVKNPDIKPVNAHPSETGLDDYHFDHEIVNFQQGYDPLIAEVKSILENHQIL